MVSAGDVEVAEVFELVEDDRERGCMLEAGGRQMGHVRRRGDIPKLNSARFRPARGCLINKWDCH